MPYVFVGAGPVSLSAAILLVKKGVPANEIILCDPRAANYTRPGALPNWVFQDVARLLHMKLGVKKRGDDKTGHIKNLEKSLLSIAQEQGINVEQKKFISLAKGGVTVANLNGEEEFIATDYVFDGSGSKRVVINAVNSKLPSSPPFQFESPFEIPGAHYFLAYVQMNRPQVVCLNRFYSNAIRFEGLCSSDLSPLDYARNLVKFRELGWQEYTLPLAAGYIFNGSKKSATHAPELIKVCLYIRAPRDLSPENYHAWVNAVIHMQAKQATYQQLDKSKRPINLRFAPITVTGQTLTTFSHHESGFPCVVPIGDSVMDPHFKLSNGIANGIERFEKSCSAMKIENGKITAFDENLYNIEVSALISKQKQRAEDQYSSDKKHLKKGLLLTQKNLAEALENTNNRSEKKKFAQMLGEIKKCLDFAAIRINKKSSITDLTQSHTTLLEFSANNGAPLAEHQLPDLHKKLLKLAEAWENQALAALKDNHKIAQIYYQKAAVIYQLPCFNNGNDLAEELLERIEEAEQRIKDSRLINEGQLLTKCCNQESDNPNISIASFLSTMNSNLSTFLQNFAQELEDNSPQKRKAITFFAAAHISRVRKTAQSLRDLAKGIDRDVKKEGFIQELRSLLNYLERHNSERTQTILKNLITQKLGDSALNELHMKL